jgi:hypothetical protein
MATYTAGDQINRALRLIGMLAEGELPSTETANDCLVALNQMIDSWNTERLSVFSTKDQVFTWPAGFINRTLGPTGNFVGNRPILLDDATYYRDASTNVSYGIKMINQQQYDGIAVKTVTSTYPQVLFINMTYPDVDMYIYPRPTRDLEWHFISVEELTQPATLQTVLAFPPGYLRAFTYSLAMEIAPEFGVEPSPQVQRIAMTSKRDLKRINNPDDVMSMPYALVATRQRFNIYAGHY